MRRIEFTEEEIQQLRFESLYHPHVLVRRRTQALLLKSEGLSHAKIGERKELKYKGKPNRLMEKKDEIIAHLEKEPPATHKEAQARIKELTGIQRSLPQVSEFLKKAGFAAER